VRDEERKEIERKTSVGSPLFEGEGGDFEELRKKIRERGVGKEICWSMFFSLNPLYCPLYIKEIGFLNLVKLL
jgi:hypothetical protein